MSSTETAGGVIVTHIARPAILSFVYIASAALLYTAHPFIRLRTRSHIALTMQGSHNKHDQRTDLPINRFRQGQPDKSNNWSVANALP